MKKIQKVLTIVMVLIVAMMPMMFVEAKTTKKKSKTTTTTTTVAKKAEPVNFYIFYGSTCGYCAALHEYTAELEKDNTINYMFNIVDYEVWSDSTNATLMGKVGTYFNTKVSGVPFYVIGDQYFSGYSADTYNEKIVDAIKKAYNNEDYVDIVAGIGSGNITVDESQETEETTTNNNKVGYIILGIALVIIVAIIFGSSKNTYTEEEAEEAPEKEEVKEEEQPKEEKKAAKKTTAKKTTKTSTAKKTTKTTKKK